MKKTEDSNKYFYRVCFFILIIVVIIVMVSSMLSKKDPCDETSSCEKYTVVVKNKWNE